MSTTEQENRLAQLKELQEELQNKLLSQLSSANYDDNSISEETRLEIIETLGEKAEESSRQQQQHEEQPNNELTFSISSLTTSTNAASSPNKSPSSSNCASSVYLNDKDGETKKVDQDTTRPNSDSAHISKGTGNYTVLSTDKTQPVDISQVRIKDALCSGDANPGSAPFGIRPEAVTTSTTSPFFTSSSHEGGTSIKHTTSPTPPVSPPPGSTTSSRRSSRSPSWMHTSTSILNDTVHDIHTLPLRQQKMAVSPGQDGRKRLPASTDCGECQSLRVHLEHLLADNDRWKVECSKLEEHIEECMSINKNFMDKNNRLMRRIANYQQECESKEQLVTVLQSRVGSMSDQLIEQNKLIADLRERNEELEEELGCFGREKKDLKELLHQTMSELDIKKVEVARIEAKMQTMESQLFNADSEAHRLKDIIAMMMEKENQLNSLEEEIKSLRHINNRLNGQYTHFKLSNDAAYSIDQSNHSLACSNVSDEGKLTTPKTGSQQQWEQSPCFTSSAGTPLDSSKEKQRMLTRRKWLEQSEGGFVFGTPSRANERKDNKENDTVYSPRPPLTPRNMPRPSPRSPNEGGANPRRYTPVNTRGTSAGGNQGESSSGRQMKSPKERIEDKVEERLRQVPLVEKRLLELQKEKEKLEHVLSRAPPTAKVTAQSKQMMIDAEIRLDEVLKEIGAARLFLWKK